METLHLLATALGVSTLAGINLYLTVFATSLALNMGWLVLSPEMQALQVLDNPLILMVAGALYFLEFFVDKVPGLDSLWDSVHTAIRPIGAALLGLAVLGETSQTLEIFVALLCGGAAFTTHVTKAGLRAVINMSPEPFTNIGASVAEDGIVILGLGAVYTHPFISGIAALCILALCIYLIPRLLRHVLAVLTYVFRKLTAGGKKPQKYELKSRLPIKFREIMDADILPEEKLKWCVPAFSGKISGFPSNRPCYLVSMEPGKRMGIIMPKKKALWMEDVQSESKSRFLYDELILYDKSSKTKATIRFDKGKKAVFQTLAKELGTEEADLT
jgi:hypothetical protein